MKRQVIEVEGLDHGSTPIPMAVRVGPLLVSSGVSGKDAATGEVPPDAEGQIAALFRNLEAILDAAGATPDDVAKLTFFVRDRDIRSAIDAQWLRLFPDADDRPARHTLVYADLPPQYLIQAEMLAFVGGE